MYRQWEKLVKQQYLLTCSHNMVNFGPLAAEIDWRVWGTPAHFNGFRVLASLLQRRRSTEVNQTLHEVWPSPGLVHYIHFRRLLSPDGILPGAKFTFRPNCCVLLYWQHYCTALQQRALAKLCGVVQGMELRNYRRPRHLYSAGWPSRWTLAYISKHWPTFLVNFVVHAVA